MNSKNRQQSYEEHNKKTVFGYTQTEIVQILDEYLSKPDEYDEFLKRMNELDEEFLPSIRDENGKLISLSQEDYKKIAALIIEAEKSDLSI